MATVANANATQRLVDLWNSLSASARVAIALMIAGGVIAAALATTSGSDVIDRTQVPLMGGYDFSLESRESAIKAFQDAKLTDYSFTGSKILVPKEKQNDYLAALASGKTGLPGNTDDAIDRYIEEQRSWWASTAESERLFRVAEERRLARVIESFPEIDQASVLVSEPPQRGTLRSRSPQGTAAVKVTTVDGAPLHPRRIDQIKQLVAGKFRDVAGPDKVEVVSDALGSMAGAGGVEAALLSDGSNQYLMTKAAFAMQIENKIRDLFADLNGLIVTVNAELDPRYRRSEKIDKREKGPVRQESSDTSSVESGSPGAAASGGEPGVKPNVDTPGAVPNQGASAGGASTVAGSAQNDETSEKEYDNGKLLTDQSYVDFEPVRVGVVVRYRVPPGEKKEGEAEATAAAAAGDVPNPTAIKEMITSLGYPGVTVDSVAVQPYVGVEPEVTEVPAPSMVSSMLVHLPSIGLGFIGFAAIAVALMISRRAPVPQLAQFAERAVEVHKSQLEKPKGEDEKVSKDDATIKFERVHEQINKMVKENPEGAAAFIRRWVLEID